MRLGSSWWVGLAVPFTQVLVHGKVLVYCMLIHFYMLLILVAITAPKPIRQANCGQASSVRGSASAAVSANSGRAKKRSRKEILLSDEESTTGEKNLTIILMRHTISKASTSEGGNSTVEAVKSLFEELKSRKDLVSQLQELEDPIYAAKILTNKKHIIEVRPIFNLVH